MEHVGVLGMHWGRRQTVPGVSESTSNLAKKDVKRHVEAKMFYGETAGTKRKLLKAELEKKKTSIPGYKEAFDFHIQNADYSKAATKAVRTRTSIDTVHKGRSLVKKLLGVTGSLTVGIASMVYYANKPRVDAFVLKKIKDLMPK